MNMNLDPTLLAFCALLLGACALTPSGSAGAEGSEQTEIATLLDDWHQAASEADREGYLSRFTEEAVFLGTDASERWTLEEFTVFVDQYFPNGRGWTYVPQERHIALDPSTRVAWVDEILHNEKYGLVRGTAVLQRNPQGWKIAHYSLTFLVPNDAAAEVVEAIKAQAAQEDG